MLRDYRMPLVSNDMMCVVRLLYAACVSHMHQPNILIITLLLNNKCSLTASGANTNLKSISASGHHLPSKSLKQFGHAGQEGPPQSIDVSVPFKIPSEHEVQLKGAVKPELFVPPSEWKTTVKQPVVEDTLTGSPEDD